MSITAGMTDHIIRTGITPVLKPLGFKKSAHTFRRAQTNCIQIVNIQGSWTNHDNCGRFTVNIAVYFPDAVKMDGTFSVTDHPLEWDCIVRERIGNLMPIGKDYWWEMNPQTDLKEIAEQVGSACLVYGIPWLNRHSSLQGAVQFMRTKNMPYWAEIFSLLLAGRL